MSIVAAMKKPSRVALYCAALAALLVAAPAAAQTLVSAGAFYTQTNEPSGNKVIIASISTAGSLTYLTSVNTGGVGVTSAATADALFSQSSVTVGGGFVFVVNAGSNTLSTFSISNFGLTLTLLNTADTQGTFPIAVAYSSSLKLACVLNGGVSNGVTCFKVASGTGSTFASKVALQISGLSDSPAGPLGTLSDIAFDVSSNQVLVSLKGNPTTPGTLYVIPVSASGVLGAAVSNTVTPSRVFFSLTNIGSSNAWAFSDAGFGYGTFTLSGSSVTGAVAVPLASNRANCWTAYAPQSGRLLVIDGAGIVTTVSVSTTTSPVSSTVVGNGTVSTGLLDATVAVIGGSEYLVAVSQNLVGVVSVKLDGNGVLMGQQSLNLTGVAVESRRLQGAAVYVSSISSSSSAATSLVWTCVVAGIAALMISA